MKSRVTLFAAACFCFAGFAFAQQNAPGDPAQGKIVFEGKGGCIGCHTVNGAGTAVGPDLSTAGTMSAAQLEGTILDPNNPPAAGGGRGRGGFGGFRRPPATIVARTKDGHEYRGARKNEDAFSIQIVDATGKFHFFEKSELADLRVETRSLMPADFSARLTRPEIQNVVAYLRSLNSLEGPKTAAVLDAGLSYDRIRNASAEPQNWLTYWGDYAGRHYSSLSQINASNVKNLQAQWSLQLAGAAQLEATPLVVDGVMYTTTSGGVVLALDAKTGRQIWRYQRTQKKKSPSEINPYNRGVAILGNRLFFGTLDAALVALDARTGTLLWEDQIGDTMQGMSITGAPLVLKDKVITGISGGEFGIRAFIDAYDPATGKLLWRTYTIPGPGEPGNETWAGDSWKHGSGATWLTGSYDPDLNTLFWAVGNPGPDIGGESRKGDNLYSSSVLALDPDTGKIKWHYQFTPHDTHDWDATEDMVLVDRRYKGQNRKLLLHGDRNGVFYVLDRTTGQFLSGTPFVRATWLKGFDEKGRPMILPESEASPQGVYVYPALGGGSNFQAPSYSPQTGWMYLHYHDGGGQYVSGPQDFEEGRQYQARGGRGPAAPPAGAAPDTQGIMAIDPETGKVQWKFELVQNSLTAGVLATGGGVVFAASAEGNLIALDAKTGKALWHFGAGAAIPAAPMSYSVDGRQYVAVSSAGVLYSFALPE